MEICSRFTGMERKDGAFLLHTDNADVKVCFVTDEIVRVRASFDHELAEESYILMTTAWEDRMDDLFKGERTRVEPFAAEVTEDDKTITFATGKVTLVVEKDPINFKLLSADNIIQRLLTATIKRINYKIRNSLIYCVNRYFLIFGVSQVQKPYRASTNSFSTSDPGASYFTFI